MCLVTGKLTANLLTGYVLYVATEHSEHTVDDNQSQASGEQIFHEARPAKNIRCMGLL